MLSAVGIWVFLISLLGMSCGAAEARVKSFLDKGEGKVGQSTRMCTSVDRPTVGGRRAAEENPCGMSDANYLTPNLTPFRPTNERQNGGEKRQWHINQVEK
jgi:hypothetical protein